MTTLQYTPAPTIKKFIKHYIPGKLFLDWIVGPVGSGKTTGIFFKLIYMASLQEKSPVDGIRRSRCVVVRSTSTQLKDTTIKSFNQFFKDGQAGKWYATDKNFVLKFGDIECEVMFRPLDTPDDVDRVLSLEVTFAIIDEFVQIPKAIVDALSVRCGRYPAKVDGGATNWGMWGATNPGMESDWWYPYCEEIPEEMPEGESIPDNWKNFKQPAGNGPDAENLENLVATYYDDAVKGKANHWIKQYIEVQWGYSLSGKPVFPMFNPDIHVSKRPLQGNRSLQLVIGYDPGMSGSGVVGMQYDDASAQLRVLFEFALVDYATDRMMSEKLIPFLSRYYQGFDVLVVPDPASANRSNSDSNTVIKTLKKHFAVKPDTNNVIETRLQPAQYYMMRLTSQGPALLIDSRCVRLIRALVGGYKYTVMKGDIRKEVPDKNGHSHIADAFTYGTRFVRTGEERAGRRIERPVPRAQTLRNTYNMR